MNIDELRGLSRAEALKRAGEWAGVGADVLDRMWMKESQRGTHPTMIGETTKWGNAKGHFQQLDHITTEWSKRLGRNLDPFDFNDSLAMTAAQLKENMQMYGNDTRKAVAAYHGGTNTKNWGKKTQAYVDAIVGPGLPPSMEIDAMSTSPAAVQAMVQEQGGRSQERTVGGLGFGFAAGGDADMRPDAATAQTREATLAAQASERQAEANVGFDDQVGATYRQATDPLYGVIARMTGSAPENGERDEEFLQDYARNFGKYESGFYGDEREQLQEAINLQDLERIKQRVLTDREEQKVIGMHGAGRAFGAQLVAGTFDPTNWLVGVGMMKAFGMAGIGSARFIEQGRAGAAAASVAAENVVGNVAQDGLLDVMGAYRGADDYALAGITGLIPSVAFSTLAYRKAQRTLLESTQEKVLHDVAQEQTRRFVQAQQNLGEGASPAAMEAEVRRIETEEITTRVRGAMAPAADEDIIPAINLDEVAGDGRASTAGNLEEVDLTAPEAAAALAPERVQAMQEQGSSMREYPAEGTQEERLAWHNENLQRFDEQLSVDVVRNQEPGVHIAPGAMNDPILKVLSQRLALLVREYLPNDSFTLVRAVDEVLPSGAVAKPDGLWMSVTGKSSVIAINTAGINPTLTAIHEIGHAIETRMLKNVDKKTQAGVYEEFNRWLALYKTPGKAEEALAQRGPLQRLAQFPELDKLRSLEQQMRDNFGDEYANYIARFREFMAEQFNKNVEAGAVGVGDANTVKMSPGLVRQFVNAFENLARLFMDAIKRGFVEPKTPIQDFFAAVRAKAAEQRETQAAVAQLTRGDAALAVPAGGWKGPQMQNPTAPRIPAADWQLATKYGLDKMPQTSPMEKAEFKAVLDLYRKAEVWAANNPVDEGRLQTLLNNSTFQSLTSTSMMLAMSQNPVARMVAGTLLENTTGAVGRRSTAALSKFMHEQTFIGNSINEFEAAFASWAKANGHSSVKAKVDNLLGGDLYPAFNKQVAEEIEARRGTSQPTNAHPAVQRAADAIEGAYERMRKAQVDTKTVGFARLPDTARGYMTHVISKEKLMTMSDSEQRAFINLLTEQFQQYEGFDLPFSQELARKYLDHARVNALGGHEVPANIHNPQSADMVKGALEAMGMNKEQVNLMMAKFSSGGPSYTKKRLDINLNQPYPDGMGGEVRLMDLFETDQLQIMRNYSRRVSGEVALAQHGVMGSQGLSLLRRSLMFGDHGPKVEAPRVLEAFDQIGAEFLGRPFGDNNNRWLDRAMTANAAARLGGMVFNQVGEAINLFTHLGVEHAFAAIGSIPRLRAELVAAAKGQPVKNGILSSLEQWGGTGEFGSEGYKLVMPFDEPNAAYRTYGADTITTLDRVLRSAGHAQGVLSGWRMVHAAQTRAAAEQIVLKSVRYVRDGIESAALRDMGITDQMAARIKKELPNVATFDAAGRVQTLDFTKAADQKLARDWAQVVLRGSRQIIQGTFIGEQGKWAHDGWLKLLTQFRTFSLTSMEKQWARGRENAGGGAKGTAAMLGIMVGSMAAAFPIYYARVMLSAQGRPNKEEYIKERLSPAAAAKATLNYIPMSGLLDDALNSVSAVGGGAYEGMTGEKLPAWAKTSGGRAGSGQDFVGSVVAPSISYVDDAWKAMQDLDNPHKAVQMLPGSRIWWLAPAINGLRPE